MSFSKFFPKFSSDKMTLCNIIAIKHGFLICTNIDLHSVVEAEWKTVMKPADLDLQCFHKQDISGFSGTRVNDFDRHD